MDRSTVRGRIHEHDGVDGKVQSRSEGYVSEPRLEDWWNQRANLSAIRHWP